MSSFCKNCYILLHNVCVEESFRFTASNSLLKTDASAGSNSRSRPNWSYRSVSSQWLTNSLGHSSIFSSFGHCSTNHLNVSFFSPTFRSVSASQFSKYLSFSSCLCCVVCFSRAHCKFRRNIDTLLCQALFCFEPSDFPYQTDLCQIL